MTAYAAMRDGTTKASVRLQYVTSVSGSTGLSARRPITRTRNELAVRHWKTPAVSSTSMIATDGLTLANESDIARGTPSVVMTLDVKVSPLGG